MGLLEGKVWLGQQRLMRPPDAPAVAVTRHAAGLTAYFSVVGAR